jgi:hypothetical protein
MGGGNGGGSVTVVGDKQLIDRAHRVESEIVKGCKAVRTAWVFLAKYLHEFTEQRMWELLSYESIGEWLASPEIELSEGHVHKLVRVYRELVVERKVPPAALEGIDLAKAQTVLPAIREGEVSWKDALDDTRSLTRGDLEEEYARGRNKPLDAEDEPERARCPTCRSWVKKDQIEDAA